MSNLDAQVCIVGGGVGGMAAAYKLQKAGVSCIVLEASDRLGGRVKTTRLNGCAFDVGAIGLLGSYAATVALIEDIGLSSKLSRAPVVLGVPRDGKLHVLDMGRPLSILKTELLSGASLWRLRKLAGPMLRHWSKLDFESFSKMVPSDTETVGSYSRRELNPELYEYLIGPIVRALWQRDPEDTPLVDLFWGLKAFAPTMYALDGGMDLLSDALAKKVTSLTGARVESVEDSADGVRVTYTHNGSTHTQSFSGCVLAVEPSITSQLLRPQSAELAQAFAALPYCNSVNVHFVTRRPLGGQVQIIFPPHSETPDLTTVVFEENKGPGRAPAGKGALSLFWRDSWSRPRLPADDADIIRDAIAQARLIIPDLDESIIEAAHVERWTNAGVARALGASTAIPKVEAASAALHRTALAGDYYVLSGVNAAIISGQRAAEQLLEKRAHG